MSGMGLLDRAVRAAERERHAQERDLLGLTRDPRVAGDRFLRQAVWDRFVVSGSEVGISWVRSPPRGSVAVMRMGGVVVLAVVERCESGVPVARFWVDEWPGAVAVEGLADLAYLSDRAEQAA
jgi:hypothetical protein